jgi:cytochrome c556
MNKEDLEQIEKLVQTSMDNAMAKLDVKLLEREQASTEKVHQLEMRHKEVTAAQEANEGKLDKIFEYIDDFRKSTKETTKVLHELMSMNKTTQDQEDRLRIMEKACGSCKEKIKDIDPMKNDISAMQKQLYRISGAVVVVVGIIEAYGALKG